MIHVEDRELPPEAARQLVSWQAELDAIPDHNERVQAALRTFKQRSRTVALRSVRETLAQMCSGLVRCCYCEDSLGHQVEHIWPKSWYPERTFVWHNFLFSCGVCNGRKNAKFAIIREQAVHELVRRRDGPRTAPPSGSAALIDPRREDPLDYLRIDLADTFFVLPRAGLDDLARRRADYTIGLLDLNRREVLLAARRQACRNYSLRTREYASLAPDTAESTRRRLLDEIGRLHHRMVWEEMKRSTDLVEGLRAQLDAAPELRMV
jgi:uncharacterized protein (TIGR02646 family)